VLDAGRRRGWIVVGRVVRDATRIEDDDVGGVTRRQKSAVDQAGAISGQPGEFVDRILEAQHAAIADVATEDHRHRAEGLRHDAEIAVRYRVRCHAIRHGDTARMRDQQIEIGLPLHMRGDPELAVLGDQLQRGLRRTFATIAGDSADRSPDDGNVLRIRDLHDQLVIPVDAAVVEIGKHPPTLSTISETLHRGGDVHVVRNEGNVQVGGFSPYPISYRSIVPRKGEAANLFVPVCLSATHIAYGSIRMEPVFMILGQTSAMAAVMALDAKIDVQSVDYAALRKRLLEAGQILAQPSSGKLGK